MGQEKRKTPARGVSMTPGRCGDQWVAPKHMNWTSPNSIEFRLEGAAMRVSTICKVPPCSLHNKVASWICIFMGIDPKDQGVEPSTLDVISSGLLVYSASISAQAVKKTVQAKGMR